MADSLYHTNTKKFIETSKVINALEATELRVVLELLLQHKDSEIEEKYKEVSELIKHIVERAAQQQATQEKIVGELKPLINVDKLKPICHYYNFYVQQILKKLDRSPVVPTHLEDVKWSVQLSLGNDRQHKILEPTGVLQFKLTDPKEQNKSSFLLEFNHEELYDFFNQLEDIQEQLDALNS